MDNAPYNTSEYLTEKIPENREEEKGNDSSCCRFSRRLFDYRHFIRHSSSNVAWLGLCSDRNHHTYRFPFSVLAFQDALLKMREKARLQPYRRIR